MEEVTALGTVMGSLEIPYTCKHLTGLSTTFVSVFVGTWRLSSVQHLIIVVWLCSCLSWRKVSFSFSLSQNEHKLFLLLLFFWIGGLLQNALPISTFPRNFFFLQFWNWKVIKKGTLLIFKNIVEIIPTLSFYLWFVWKTSKQWGFTILRTFSLESEICADWWCIFVCS